MKKNQLVILVALVVILLGVAGVIYQQDQRQVDSVASSDLFLPDLAAVINEVNQIKVASANDENLSLSLVDGEWRVTSAANYYADFGEIKSVLSELAQVKLKEKKTNRPENHSKLGVEDLANAASDSNALQLTLASDSKVVADVILGNYGLNKAGRYARIVGDDQVWLLSSQVRTPATKEDWMSRQIIDVAASDVTEVSVRHADEPAYVIHRAEGSGADFSLVDIPEGKEAAEQWKINQMGGLLDNLYLNNVVAAEKFSLPEPHNQLVFKTKELARIEVKHAKGAEDGVYYITLDVSALPDASAEQQAAVEAMQKRTKGWVYAIDGVKGDIFARDLAMLVTDVAKEAPESDGAGE
ncbi:MAG: hypothetical protein CMF25_06480 [Kangiellaceae bacterium]|jgi:hypothetical protein|nr:hypothetical protein [Kangiellaceae bacterium]|tara:strand:+ start:5849 stop:6913 length:1065 start_codon:yes stop_codon:yes gene_type:complete